MTAAKAAHHVQHVSTVVKDAMISEAEALTAIKSEGGTGQEEFDALVSYSDRLRALDVPIFNLDNLERCERYKSPRQVNHTDISDTPMEVFQAKRESDMVSHVILDLGCARSVRGLPWLMKRLNALKEKRSFFFTP